MSVTWDSNEIAKGIVAALEEYLPLALAKYNQSSAVSLIAPSSYRHRRDATVADVTSPYIEITIGDMTYTPLGGTSYREMVDASFEISYQWTHSGQPNDWPDYSRAYAGIIARALNLYLADCRSDGAPPFHESVRRGARVEREVSTEGDPGQSAVVLLVQGTTGPMEGV
jgi:hypothetical protein